MRSLFFLSCFPFICIGLLASLFYAVVILSIEAGFIGGKHALREFALAKKE